MKTPGGSGRMNTGVAVALALAAAALLMLNLRSCGLVPAWGSHDSWSIGSWHYNPFGVFYGFLGLYGLIQIGLAVWVGVDAQRRGSNGYLWGLLVFFTPLIGLIVYLLWASDVMRRVAPPVPPGSGAAAAAVPADPAGPDAGAGGCPSCGKAVESEFKACPWCGATLTCPSCNRPRRPDWKVCPYCATTL